MSITRAVKSAVQALAAAMVVHGETRSGSLLGERQHVVRQAHDGKNVLPWGQGTPVQPRGRQTWV